jgi:hypothetical protein
MNVSIPVGAMAVPMQAGQGSALCRWDAAEAVTLAAAPPAGQSRIDVVVCQVHDDALDGGGLNDFVFAVVQGAPAAANPVVPATPANAAAMCTVTVPGAVANLNTATVTDQRPPLGVALGRVTEAYGPAAQTDITAMRDIVTLTFRAVAGRRYRISGFAVGTQNSNPASSYGAWTFVDEAGVTHICGAHNAMANNIPCAGSIAYQMINAATRMVTYAIRGYCSTGWMRTAPNTCWLIAEDIGPA